MLKQLFNKIVVEDPLLCNKVPMEYGTKEKKKKKHKYTQRQQNLTSTQK